MLDLKTRSVTIVTLNRAALVSASGISTLSTETAPGCTERECDPTGPDNCPTQGLTTLGTSCH
jgi:hypothetical protein